MRADSLNEKISHRPTPSELVKEGVLHEDPTAADDLYAERIEDEYAKREGGAQDYDTSDVKITRREEVHGENATAAIEMGCGLVGHMAQRSYKIVIANGCLLQYGNTRRLEAECSLKLFVNVDPIDPEKMLRRTF